MFNRCIELWNYALDMQQSMLEPLDPMTQSSLFSFTELFSFMIGRQINTGRRVPQVQREELLKVFRKAVLEVKLGKQMLDKGSARGRDIAYLNRVLITTLHLASLLTHEMPEEDTPEYTGLHQALYELVQVNPKDNNDRTVLHLVFSERNTVLGAGPKSLSFRFPSPYLIKALLKVGADVSAKDATGSTVLHLAAMFHPSLDLVTLLLDAGAHIDAVNKMGSTFESLIWSSNVYDTSARNMICPMRYTKLTCLAARVVRKAYDIKSVPIHLQEFVQMH